MREILDVLTFDLTLIIVVRLIDFTIFITFINNKMTLTKFEVKFEIFFL